MPPIRRQWKSCVLVSDVPARREQSSRAAPIMIFFDEFAMRAGRERDFLNIRDLHTIHIVGEIGEA